jgi:molybdopterin molybdotransferase
LLKNIEPSQATKLLCALDVQPETEIVSLADAFGRVSARRICACIPSPPFDRSPYDGYVFRGEDTAAASPEHPVVLTITEEIPAGTAPRFPVTPGTAAKILTGAPIPEGANVTVKYETVTFTEDTVTLTQPYKPDTDIVRSGEDIAAGDVIMERGTIITAPLAGILAGQGICQVEVFKKPVVALINTGSELVEPGNPLRPAAIYNSNVYMLAGYLMHTGAVPHNAGIVEDEPDRIAEKIRTALENCDMVITTGGASVGDYDWAVTAAERLGAKVLFWKTNMKPGGSIMAAEKDGKVILGLSGNPGAAVLGLLRIALPYIRKLCGRADIHPPEVCVALRHPLNKHSPKTRILRGRLEVENGQALFSENEGQENGAVLSLVGCDLLAEIPAGSPPLPAGTMVRAFRV